MNKKRLGINLIANIISFLVTFGISFFLTPFITQKLGAESFGFVSLGNNLISYARIVTAAINSMAARFITVALHSGKEQEAKRYFSSVVISNIVLSAALLIPMAITILYIGDIFNISESIIKDVRLLWIFLFAGFLLSIIMSVYECAQFIKNRLDLSAKRSIAAQLIKAGLLVVLFAVFVPNVWYVGLASLVMTIYTVITNMRYKRMLTPEMRFDRRNFSLSSVKTLLSAGVWNSISSLSMILLSGLDLLIANLFIGGDAMGVLAVSKTVPQAIGLFVTTISKVFVPELTKAYAQNDTRQIKIQLNTAIKILSFLATIPLIIILVYGRSFYTLWVPTQDARVLHILTLLAIGSLFITSTIKPLYAVYIITNRVRLNSITLLIQGIVSTATVFILLSLLPSDIINSTTDPMGLYIIAGTSSTYGIIRALAVTPVQVSKCMNIKWNTFYKPIGQSLLSILIGGLIAYGMSCFLPAGSWVQLCVAVVLTAVIIFPVNLLILLNVNERKILKSKLSMLLSKDKKDHQED